MSKMDPGRKGIMESVKDKMVGSIKGTLVCGSIMDYSAARVDSSYRHDVWEVSHGGGAMLQARPEYKVGGLGFCVNCADAKIDSMVDAIQPRILFCNPDCLSVRIAGFNARDWIHLRGGDRQNAGAGSHIQE